MAEDQAPQNEETPQTPDQAAPEGTPADEPEVDYRQRYDSLRPEYDRGQQELSQYRDFYAQLANPETQAEALEALGLQLAQEEEDEDEEFTDPTDEIKQRLDAQEQYLAQQAEAQEEMELQNLEDQYLEQSIAELEKEHGKLSDAEKAVFRNLSYAYPDEDGVPGVAAAYEAFADAAKEAQSRYLESKKAPKVGGEGVAGVDNVDLSNEEERLKAAAAIIEAEAIPD